MAELTVMQQHIKHDSGVEHLPAMIEVGLRNAYDANEYVSLEESLRKLQGVATVHLDRTGVWPM